MWRLRLQESNDGRWRGRGPLPAGLTGFELVVKCARYEARRACRQYDAEEPESRHRSSRGFGRAAMQLARYYVGLTQAWTHPDAAIGVKLPHGRHDA
jgi:hypothetical protein